jgi:hypothetical protein
MACRCAERAASIRRVAAEVVRGNVKNVSRETADNVRTFIAAVRSGDLRRAATQRLAAMRGRR